MIGGDGNGPLSAMVQGELREETACRAGGVVVIAVDRFGGIYVVGTFSGTVDFFGHELSSHLDALGKYRSRDAFIWYTGRGED